MNDESRVLGQRAGVERWALAILLPAVAGAVNSAGFLAVGTYTSHVTGATARIGDELAQRHLDTALSAGLWVLAFFLGSVTATLIVERGSERSRARYAPALVLEAALFGVFALLEERGTASAFQGGLTLLLCFSMGLQNGLVTRLSGAIVRTTHLTGIVTDAGIELVRVGRVLRQRFVERRPRASLKGVLSLGADPELRKLRLHASVFGSFLVGAVAGPFLYLRHHSYALAAPCLVLFGLAAFDWVSGMGPPPPPSR